MYAQRHRYLRALLGLSKSKSLKRDVSGPLKALGYKDG